MRDAQLARDVARPHAVVRELHDPLTHHVRQRPSVDEHAAQLVYAAMACNNTNIGHQAVRKGLTYSNNTGTGE